MDEGLSDCWWFGCVSERVILLHSPPFANHSCYPRQPSGYCTSFIQSAHKYRDRDIDRSYPLAESRDEISQRLLISNGTKQNRKPQKETKPGWISSTEELQEMWRTTLQQTAWGWNTCWEHESIVVASHTTQPPQIQKESPGSSRINTGPK